MKARRRTSRCHHRSARPSSIAEPLRRAAPSPKEVADLVQLLDLMEWAGWEDPEEATEWRLKLRALAIYHELPTPIRAS